VQPLLLFTISVWQKRCVDVGILAQAFLGPAIVFVVKGKLDIALLALPCSR
jgi:hypothetical protein